MIYLHKHWVLTVVLISLLIGCSSSKETMNSESEPEINNTQVVTASAVEESPDRMIKVLINERVEYKFIKRDTSWTGIATQFDTNDTLTQKVTQVFNLDPINGWSDFEEMIQFLDIYTMQDQTEIENRKAGSLSPQSRSYTFTVFDGDTTRSYTYFNPEGEITNHWQSQKIATFGSYIATEMSVVQ